MRRSNICKIDWCHVVYPATNPDDIHCTKCILDTKTPSNMFIELGLADDFFTCKTPHGEHFMKLKNICKDECKSSARSARL